MFSLFRKKEEPEVVPTEQELNVIRVFALGNDGLRESAINIVRKYIRYAIKRPDVVELQFMREVDNPCPDLALRSMYRKKIQETY